MDEELELGRPAQPPGPPPPGGPFRITISKMSEGREVDAVCHIDPREQLYLNHHTFGRNVSQVDRDLHGMMVIPLTVCAEIMAQSGALLVPAKRLVAMRDVRVFGYVEIKDDKPCTYLKFMIPKSALAFSF